MNIIDQAKAVDRFYLQLGKKVVGYDGITRDEGIWLFVQGINGAKKLEDAKAPWKQMTLTDRIGMLAYAFKINDHLFRYAIKVEQEVDGKAGTILHDETIKGLTDGFDQRHVESFVLPVDGYSKVNRSLDCGGQVVTKIDRQAQEPIAIYLLCSNSMIQVLRHFQKINKERFDKAIATLKGWDHLVKTTNT